MKSNSPTSTRQLSLDPRPSSEGFFIASAYYASSREILVVSSDPSSWKEAKAKVEPGPIWSFRRGYRVNEAGKHENEQQYRAFQFYLNSAPDRSTSQTAEHVGVSPSAISTWKGRYEWDRRCAAFDKKELTIAFREANKMQRRQHRREIDDFRRANQEQAKMMMDVSSDIVEVIQKRIAKAAAEGEDIPMGLVSGLLRAAANISESGRQAWATSLGVNELMQVVDTELEEVQVEVMEDDTYDIPLDE